MKNTIEEHSVFWFYFSLFCFQRIDTTVYASFLFELKVTLYVSELNNPLYPPSIYQKNWSNLIPAVFRVTSGIFVTVYLIARNAPYNLSNKKSSLIPLVMEWNTVCLICTILILYETLVVLRWSYIYQLSHGFVNALHFCVPRWAQCYGR